MPDLPVGVDELVHGLGVRLRLLPSGCGGDHRLEIEFIGVEQQANEGHLVVGLVADVAEDDDARLAGEVVDVIGR